RRPDIQISVFINIIGYTVVSVPSFWPISTQLAIFLAGSLRLESRGRWIRSWSSTTRETSERWSPVSSPRTMSRSTPPAPARKASQHLERLRISVSRALDEVKARREITRLTKREEGKYRTDQLIGESDSTRRLRDIIGQLARSEAHTILIHGESGTGKELVAKG